MKRNPSDLLERDSPKAKDDSEVEYKEWNEFNMFEKVYNWGLEFRRLLN